MKDPTISESDERVILRYAKKYGVAKVILFGSSVERADARDTDIGVKGLAPERFFDSCWKVY
jgi:predicted nucleotidyltransferase